MKPLLILVFFLGVLMVLTACGGGDATVYTDEESPLVAPVPHPKPAVETAPSQGKPCKEKSNGHCQA